MRWYTTSRTTYDYTGWHVEQQASQQGKYIQNMEASLPRPQKLENTNGVKEADSTL